MGEVQSHTCEFKRSYVSFGFNIGEIDLEGWRRKLDALNMGYMKFSDYTNYIAFGKSSVEIYYQDKLYIIHRNGDIDIGFHLKDFYGKASNEILKRDIDNLILENLSIKLRSLIDFLRKNGFDISSDRFIVKGVAQVGNFIVNRRDDDDNDRWECHIDLKRFKAAYENEMNIEYKVFKIDDIEYDEPLIIKFQNSNYPNLRITVELGNNVDGYVVGQVKPLDQVPTDVLSNEGISVIRDYLTQAGNALYNVIEAIEKIKAYKLVRLPPLF